MDADDARDALLAHARALVMPSPFESLSLVVLEAWNRGTPVIVNGRCRPLKGQVTRANGGVYYELAGEFVEAVRLMAGNPALARSFGRQGLEYVDRAYRWEGVMKGVESVLESTKEQYEVRSDESVMAVEEFSPRSSTDAASRLVERCADVVWLTP